MKDCTHKECAKECQYKVDKKAMEKSIEVKAKILDKNKTVRK